MNTINPDALEKLTTDDTWKTPLRKQGKLIAEPGQPLKFVDEADVDSSETGPDSLMMTVGKTISAYMKAVRKLLDSNYADQKQAAPPHMQEPCNVSIIRCSDGIFIRYDATSEGKACLRCMDVGMSLSEISPQFSEQIIHFPENPETYVPQGWPELRMTKIDHAAGTINEVARVRLPVIYVKKTLPDGFQMPEPSARPPCLASLQNEFDVRLHGIIVPLDAPIETPASDTEKFIAYSRLKFPVGWQAIEIYPLLGDDYWKPEYAPNWAELDLLAVIAQKNALGSELRSIDSRGATRKKYAALLEEFEMLLAGSEEPVHQFLKKHHEFLSPTATRYWSKLAFGNRVSDFVFCEPYNDYLLVEIESASRQLFRKDGQQCEELTHAINQITDWVQYIQDNRQKVEEEIGLTGISTNPRTLVVIGRSSSLTEDNRRKLVTLQAQANKLCILTYDDLLVRARANLERILGPLSIQGQNVELYFYKDPSLPSE